MAHARLSPSNTRWPHCPGSIREESAYPDAPGRAAIDGTGTHLLLETCLKTGDPKIKASKFINQILGLGHEDMPEGWFIDAERAARVQVALDYITHRDDEIGGATVTTESLSSPGALFGRDDWWGTCDVDLRSLDIETNPVLEVIDYKDGQMFVAVEDNTQLIAYAAGKANGCKFSHVDGAVVRMTIIQPKIEKRPIRFVEMSFLELGAAVDKLNKAAELTDDPDAVLVHGDHCQWCKHKNSCTEYAAQGLEGVAAMVESTGPLFESLQDGQIAVGDMSADKLASILDARAIISALLANVEKEAETRIKSGEQIPGYSIGKGRKSKVWNDDLAMVEKKLTGMRFLKTDLYPPTLISPAQALKKPDLTKRQKERITKELIIEVAGKNKLVKSTLIPPTVEEMFGKPVNVTEPEEALSPLSFY